MHSGEDSAVAVPDYVLFDFIETKNKGPPARWGHTAVVVDHKLFIYGGEGSQAYGDLQIYEPGIGCIVLYPIGFEADPQVMVCWVARVSQFAECCWLQPWNVLKSSHAAQKRVNGTMCRLLP